MKPKKKIGCGFWFRREEKVGIRVVRRGRYNSF